jgi:hypothetical protein
LQSAFPRKRKNYQILALLFGAALILLLLAEFSSFGIGAYFVFDKPISNVVAVTSPNPNGASLQVKAVSLTNASKRSVWVDPQIESDANGNLLVATGTGFLIATVVTNSTGGISRTFNINQSTLNGIDHDGTQVHEVWIIGINSSGSRSATNLVSTTSDSEENYSAASRGSGITLFATLFTFQIPVSFSFGELFLALWTIYLIFFAMAMNGPLRNVLGAMKDVSVKGVRAIFENSMFATLLVFPVVVWVTVALSLLEQAGGVSTGSLPTVDPLLQMVELTLAPLREELGFRVIPIGLATLLILFSRGRIRDGLLALWHPSRYLKKNDTPAQYKRNLSTIYVMIGISAVLFGLAHVLLGAGWGPGKILSAAVAGVGLAGLYYFYGLPAAVLLHWSIDYFLSTFDLIPSLQTWGGIITLYTLGVSVAGSVVLVLILVRRFRNRTTTSIVSDWSTEMR